MLLGNALTKKSNANVHADLVAPRKDLLPLRLRIKNMTSKPMTLGPSKSCMILPQPKSTLFWRYAAEDPQITRAVLPR